jgi:3-hydroxy-9,10-secoandrosta-1,3,5(10)-triene-9,17-dione monooxygenase
MTVTRPGVVPVPEGDLTPAEMIGRARALRDELRADQAGAEQRGFYSAELHEAFNRAGFYRMLQPRRFGGYEFDLPTYYRISIEIGRGASAGPAWCLNLAQHHSLLIGSYWPEEAQREIFGPDGHFISAQTGQRASGGATARAVDGGYLINGHCRFASGVPYSTHHILHVRLESSHPGGPPAGSFAWACVPRDQYEILSDWGNFADLGLQGSGSNSVLLKDAWIAKHWLVADDFRSFDQRDGTPGTRLHGNPMYLGCHTAMHHAGLVAPQIGAVRAALDEFDPILRERPDRIAADRLLMEDRGFQTAFGLATVLCDTAEMILIRSGQVCMEYFQRWAETGQPFTPEDDDRQFAALQQAGRLAWRAMEQIWTNSPVDVAKASARMQRYYRDLSMYRLHISARPLNLAPRIAQEHFGLL